MKKKARKRGRKTIFTPEIQNRIVQSLLACNYVETACAFAGIGVTAFYDWLNRGARGQKPFDEFSKAVRDAQAQAEMKLIISIEKKANGRAPKFDMKGKVIEQAIESDWRAGAWILERKFPERWGKRDQVKLYEAKTGEDFRPDGSYERMLEQIIREIEEEPEDGTR